MPPSRLRRSATSLAALARVKRGLALEPDTFYGYVAEGQIRRAAGKPTEAAAAFNKALALSPGLAVAEYELGALAEQAGDRSSAVNHYQRALASEAGMTEAREAPGAAGTTAIRKGVAMNARKRQSDAPAWSAGVDPSPTMAVGAGRRRAGADRLAGRSGLGR